MAPRKEGPEARHKEIGHEKKTSTRTSGTVVGMDLGDQYSHYYMMDSEGEEIERGRAEITRVGISKRFSAMEKVKVVVVAGTHSASFSPLLK